MRVVPSQDCSTAGDEEPDDHDVVLIKEETAKEEVDADLATTDELLISEDGERAGNTSLTPKRSQWIIQDTKQRVQKLIR